KYIGQRIMQSFHLHSPDCQGLIGTWLKFMRLLLSTISFWLQNKSRQRKKQPLKKRLLWPHSGRYVPGAIRTPDRRLRRALLYPAELLGHCFQTDGNPRP